MGTEITDNKKFDKQNMSEPTHTCEMHDILQ